MIRLAKSGRQIEVQSGVVLMDALLDAGVPVASSCAGEAVCGKCLLVVVEGAENLSPPTDDEKFLRESQTITKPGRISCQARVLGDVTVDAPYW